MASIPSKSDQKPSAEMKVSEYVIRAPAENDKKKFSIIQFQDVDLTKYKTAKIEKENNVRNYKLSNNFDQMPKFGSGSEFGREAKDEARRKKFGVRTKKYNLEDQPYILKCINGKQVKRYKSQQVGSIQDSANYYVFTQCTDGAFQIKPVDQYHKFTQLSNYQTLDPEEAEKQFELRSKTLNYFSIMVQKKMVTDGDGEAADDDDPDDPNGKKKKKGGSKSDADGKANKSFLLTEMDGWIKNDSDMSSPDDSDTSQKKTPKAKKKKTKTAKRKKQNSDDEALEESDEFDEGREVDYMTSSDSNDEMMYSDKARNNSKYEEKGVEDEEGLRKLGESDSSEDDDEKSNKNKAQNKQSAEEEVEEVKSPTQLEDIFPKDSSSDSSDSDSDSDFEKNSNLTSALFMQNKIVPEDVSMDASNSEAPKEEKSMKRKREDDQGASGAAPAAAASSSSSSVGASASNASISSAGGVVVSSSASSGSVLSGDSSTFSDVSTTFSDVSTSKRARYEVDGDGEKIMLITPESIKRYLQRKPMTTTDLIQKFKSKNTGLAKQNLVQHIVQTLKQVKYEMMKTKENKLLLYCKKD